MITTDQGSRLDGRASRTPLVSVVVVNWNGKHLLQACLDSLLAQSFQDVEIILVDNGSEDGSVAYVQERYPTTTVVPLRTNRGFAGGNNAGISVAAGDYIALLNNDAEADPRWLEHLVSAAEEMPGAGMLACKVLTHEDPRVIDSAGLVIYWDGTARGRGRLEPDRGQYDRQEEVLFPSGCAGLYRKEMLDEVGLFDEDFFAYADDVDLGLRGRLAGWGALYVPSARVYHKYSSSSSDYSPLKAFLVERNRIWVLFKYFPIGLIMASPYFMFKKLLLQLYGALTGRGASGKFSAEHSLIQALAILVKAWCSAARYLPRILRQRRARASLKRVRRAELYRLFRDFGISAAEIALKE